MYLFLFYETEKKINGKTKVKLCYTRLLKSTSIEINVLCHYLNLNLPRLYLKKKNIYIFKFLLNVDFERTQ